MHSRRSFVSFLASVACDMHNANESIISIVDCSRLQSNIEYFMQRLHLRKWLWRNNELTNQFADAHSEPQQLFSSRVQYVFTEEQPIPFCIAKRKRGNCFPRLENYFLLNYLNRTLKGETKWANCSGGTQKMRPKMKLFALCIRRSREAIGIVRS